MSFNSKAAVTMHSYFGAQVNKICNSFFFLKSIHIDTRTQIISVSADLSHVPKMVCSWYNPRVTTTITYLYIAT